MELTSLHCCQSILEIWADKPDWKKRNRRAHILTAAVEHLGEDVIFPLLMKSA